MMKRMMTLMLLTTLFVAGCGCGCGGKCGDKAGKCCGKDGTCCKVKKTGGCGGKCGCKGGAKAPATIVLPSVAGEAVSIVLPKGMANPDGMLNTPCGCGTFLVVTNVSHPGCSVLMMIDKDNKITKVIDLPLHPETKTMVALGVAVGSDGNLYIADNQEFAGHGSHKARLLRVVVKDKKAVKVETVVTGMIAANAVVAYKDRLYITETTLKAGQAPHQSGVYGFSISELQGDTPLAIKPDGTDSHLIATLTTTADDWCAGIGANGLAITPGGMMYVSNFGTAEILGGQLCSEGKLDAPLKVVAKGTEENGMGSVDGMKYIADKGVLIVADFHHNGVCAINPKTGEVKTLVKNANSDGSKGQMDKPSEVCLRGNTLYVSNIDLGADGNNATAEGKSAPDGVDTIVAIPLKW
ncbi:MAG: hypothetical protein HN909_04140 [Phycisphaerales bacterium]|jgi:sugar lactone lactonase YvrE|nr:hypothetical protein [Phycisphaerales bacterium]MBT7170942.1 hypothetical protein [Phycisphaerales bacterium]